MSEGSQQGVPTMWRKGFCLAVALALGGAAPGRAAEAASVQEETVALEACPAAVQAALAKAAEKGAIRRVRRLTEGGVVSYVGRIEVVVDGEGKPLPPRPVPAETDPIKAAADKAAAAEAALARQVTLDLAAVRLQEACSLLTAAAGVPVSCGNAVASRLVTASFKDTPLSEVLKRISEQTETRAEPREGGYRFRAPPAK